MPEKKVRSVCAYCGVGCEINAGVKDQKIVGIHPVQNAPVNKGHLCVKGRYAWEYVYANDRITQPMIRRQNQWETVSWNEAIDYSAKKLKSILQEHGPGSIGIIGSARATNEDNYCIQKFARTVIGTNNVDNCARVCHQPTTKAMSMVLAVYNGLAQQPGIPEQLSFTQNLFRAKEGKQNYRALILNHS